MKRISPRTYQSSSSSPRSAKQIGESKRTLKRHLGKKWKKVCTLCNTWSGLKKNWRLNCLFSKMSTFVTETSFQFKEWSSESLQQRFRSQNKTKRIKKTIFPFGNKIYIQSRLNLKGLAKRPKTLLSKKQWNSSKLSFFSLLTLPFPAVIAFHRVKKSSLIIGIVDPIKINS